MGLGLGDIMKIKGAWEKFSAAHPRFVMFLKTTKEKGFPAGTVFEVSVTYPDGEKLATNLKVTEADLDLINTVSKLGK